MAKPMYMIREITPTLKKWSAKVLVESRGDPRAASTSPRRFQPLILIDEEGTRVNATIYDSDISKFENTLNMFQTYSISNARVCEPKSGVVNNVGTYHWIINSKTVVNKILNDVIPRRVAAPRYIPLSEITPLPMGSTLDILAVVLVSFGSCVIERVVNGKMRRYSVAEFEIVDERSRPLILALWNNVATAEGAQLATICYTTPVISATKLTTSAYYGLSLGSTPNTTISLNPDLPAARKLHSWIGKNTALKTQYIEALEVAFRERRPVVDVNVAAIPISSADDLEYDVRFTVRGTVQITDDDQKFFYMGCEECGAGYAAEHNWTIECRTCKQTTRAIPRAVVIVQISDESGDLSAALFGEDAVKLLGRSPLECMQYYDAGEAISVEPVNVLLMDQTYTVQLKKTLRRTAYEEETRYVVVALSDELPAAAAAGVDAGGGGSVPETSGAPDLSVKENISPNVAVDKIMASASVEDMVGVGSAAVHHGTSAEDKGKEIIDESEESSDSDIPLSKLMKIVGYDACGRVSEKAEVRNPPIAEDKGKGVRDESDDSSESDVPVAKRLKIGGRLRRIVDQSSLI